VKKKIIGVLITIAILATGLTAIPIMADAANHLDHVQITPTSAALAVGTTQQFSAQAYDESNQPITNVTYFWLVIAGGGTITSTGLFTAGTVPSTYSNTVEVLAVQGTTVKLASVSVTVVTTIGPLHHIQVTPANATVAPGGIKQFTAQGYDQSNVPIAGLTYNWSVSSGGGAISTSGQLTVGTTTGTYTVQAVVNSSAVAPGTTTVIIATNPSPTTTPTKSGGHSLFSMFKGYLKNIGSDNFLGGQWQVKNGSNIDTIKMISGVVQTAEAMSLSIKPNGQTAPITFTLTTSTVIQPKSTVFAANDKVMVVTVNDQVTMVAKINTPSTSEKPPGLNKQDDNNKHEEKDTPHGWSHGNKAGWNKDSSDGNNESDSDND
jgi:hypothetical protein